MCSQQHPGLQCLIVSSTCFFHGRGFGSTKSLNESSTKSFQTCWEPKEQTGQCGVTFNHGGTHLLKTCQMMSMHVPFFDLACRWCVQHRRSRRRVSLSRYKYKTAAKATLREYVGGLARQGVSVVSLKLGWEFIFLGICGRQQTCLSTAKIQFLAPAIHHS